MHLLIRDIAQIALVADVGNICRRTRRHGVARNIDGVGMRRIDKDANVMCPKIRRHFIRIERRIMDRQMPACRTLRLEQLLPIGTHDGCCHVISRFAEAADDGTPVLRPRCREDHSPGSRF